MLYWVNKCLALEVPWKCCWVLSHWWILRNRSAGFAVLALPPVFLTALDHSKPQSASTGTPFISLRCTPCYSHVVLFALELQQPRSARWRLLRDVIILVPMWSSARCQCGVAHPKECIFLAHWVHEHFQLRCLASVTVRLKSSPFNSF